MDKKTGCYDEFIKTQKIALAQERKRILIDQRNGQYPRSFSFPVGIQFELTAQCNMHCKHCYNRSDIHSVSDMKVSDWLNTINCIIDSGGIFQCILSGGEPLLLGEDLFEIMSPLHADGTAFVLITNGYLVTEEFVDRLKNFEFYWVQVSIDHLYSDGHDQFREKEGSWKKAVHAAELFSSAGLPLRIAHSVTPDNLKLLGDFIDFVYMLGASSIVCGEIMLSGRTAENRNLLLSQDELNVMHEIIENYRQKYAGRMMVMTSVPETLSLRNKTSSPNTSIIIRPNGDVRLDCTLPFVIGNVLENSLSEIWTTYGNTCFSHPLLVEYCKNQNSEKFSEHINHYSPDFRIYEREMR